MDLQALADSRLFVVLCYCFSFGPWGILFAIDFISPKWRTIRQTRTAGIIHLVFSIIPLGVAVFYFIAQMAAGDNKEMMAACIAAIVALYHIFRTISGLAQLRAYSIWCAKAVDCLHKLEKVDVVHRHAVREHKDWQPQHISRFGVTESTVPGPIVIENGYAEFIDTRMYVNNQVIDNELFDSELSVRLCIPRCGVRRGILNLLRLRFDDWLCCEEIVRCSLRWTVAVLSHFGRKWVHEKKLKSFSRPNDDLHLPYQMKVPARFHDCIHGFQNALATDALFYNGGVLDNFDIYLRNDPSELDLSKSQMKSLKDLDTMQVLYFLALVARNGDDTDLPMVPADANV